MSGDIETNPGPGIASIYPPTSIRSLVINCNGIASKKAELDSVIDYTDHGVLIITETKIDDTVHTSEFLPLILKRLEETAQGEAGVCNCVDSCQRAVRSKRVAPP